MFFNTLKQYTIVSSLFLLASCADKKPQQQMPQGPQAVPVTLEEVKTADASYQDEYPATVTALDVVELRPQVSGFVTGVHFSDGARVRKGQLLYSIDTQLYEANYDQAVANLKVQEANLVKAQKDANRFHELEKNDAVAKQLVDNADAALEVAKKQVEAANASIRGVQTNVRYTKVFAPFDGTIGISAVKKGAAVTAGQTVLNTVSTDNQLAVDFNVDQKEIYHFASLLQKGRSLNDSTFTLAFGNEVYPHNGKIVLLDRAVDPQTGTIKTRLVFPNPKNLLRSGMTGTVRVLNSSSQAIVIPYKAVSEQLGEYFVYVPGDSSKVSQRRVSLGTAIGTNIIVKNGLKGGEKIVVEGIQNLREGSVITTADPAAAASAAPKK
ncbi:membrane fusion protein, multidrug efflux system [Pseudarcicella hirudinis]|uniref:Membrane fusion protein, multidrug efflux system n=1 Tax=Pseudarcicella hirudinis TaxID=1079859 RepID=A0A1I5SJ00_9BACT|nr:efflux RND transporter periplasmic adaptor subunit [Pseudarcicella hirudinis]SFP70699.1 membrane fusion protein, multidrug efflux system [Pseudarcicella hirudinis]